MTFIAYVFRKLLTAKDVLRQMSKSPFSEDPSTGDIVKEAKHCKNMVTSIFNIFNDHCEGNQIR